MLELSSSQGQTGEFTRKRIPAEVLKHATARNHEIVDISRYYPWRWAQEEMWSHFYVYTHPPLLERSH